jgi:DNA-binding response OmpR family regulator
MKKKVLVVEDDTALARIVRDNLQFEGYDVECLADGAQVLARAKAFNPDLVILDVMLPGANGFDLCAALSARRRVPIMMLTARAHKADKLRGLHLGADDYLTKPFDLDELLARVKALFRRTRPTSDTLTMGAVTIDFVQETAHRGKAEFHLTHREYELLKYLSERHGVAVHRDELLREIWGFSEAPFTRAVDNAIGRLRKKIELDAHRPRFIHTVHGDGYMLTPEGKASS